MSRTWPTPSSSGRTWPAPPPSAATLAAFAVSSNVDQTAVLSATSTPAAAVTSTGVLGGP